ncbi:MAG: hypothetical protein GX951_03250 [Mollicutes bacterium]|nr:hypothetical protein [Mollicutes bacterium]
MDNNEKNNQNNIESLYEQKNNIEQIQTSKKLSLFSKIIFVILFINAIFLVPFAVKFWFLWLMFGGLGGNFL